MDQGNCTLLPDNRIFCIYGDTITTFWDAADGRSQWDAYQFEDVCPSNGGISGGSSGCLGLKAMSLIPAVGGNPADPSGCNAIPGLDTALTAGQTPTINYTNCWKPVYVTNSSHLAGSQPAMASQTVSGLGTDADGINEVILAGHTPSAAFVVGDNLYIEWNVTRKGVAAVGNGGYQMESILMQCGPTSAITDILTTELPCAKTYVWSQAPMIVSGMATVTNGSGTVTRSSGGKFSSYMTTAAGGGGTGAYQLVFVDTTNQQEYRITGYTDDTHITISPVYAGASGSIGWNVMQHQQTNIGKFVDSSTSVFTVAGLPWASQLPPALQSAATILCTWGSSWAWRQSNLYLMCMDAANTDTATYTYDPARVNGSSGGLQQAYYLTALSSSGVPSWTLDATDGAENQATPLLTTWNHNVASKFVSPDPNGDVSFNIGKPSVRYSPALQRFVLTYGSAETQGLKIRTSSTPWGPWSVEETLLPNDHDLSTGSWESKMTSPSAGGYRFNLTLPHNSPVVCAGCTNSVATNVMYEATDPATQVSASDLRVATLICAAALSLTLSACLVDRNITRPRRRRPRPPTRKPPRRAPESGGWTVAQPSSAKLRGKWWEIFNDPRAERPRRTTEYQQPEHQTILRELSWRLAPSCARRARNFSPLCPLHPRSATTRISQNLKGSTTVTANGTGSSFTTQSTLYTLPAEASWAPDLWGKVRNTVREEQHAAQVSAAESETSV